MNHDARLSQIRQSPPQLPTYGGELARPATANGHADDQSIRQWLTLQIADLLTVAPEQVNPAETFTHYGLSSAEAVILAGDLGDWLGRDLPPTLAWDYPSINALAGYLAAECQAAGAAAGRPQSRPAN